MAEDRVDLLPRGNEEFARGYHAALHFIFTEDSVGCHGRKYARTPRHLSPLLAYTPEVMMGYTGGYDRVEHGDILSGSGSHAGRDEQVGMKVINKSDSSYGGIDLTDATLHHCHFIATYRATVHHSLAGKLYCRGITEHGQQKPEFLAHGYYDSDLHSSGLRVNFYL